MAYELDAEKCLTPYYIMKLGIPVYQYLMYTLCSEDISKEKYFRNTFKKYYNMRESGKWMDSYFALIYDCRTSGKQSVET